MSTTMTPAERAARMAEIAEEMEQPVNKCPECGDHSRDVNTRWLLSEVRRLDLEVAAHEGLAIANAVGCDNCDTPT